MLKNGLEIRTYFGNESRFLLSDDGMRQNKVNHNTIQNGNIIMPLYQSSYILSLKSSNDKRKITLYEYMQKTR